MPKEYINHPEPELVGRPPTPEELDAGKSWWTAQPAGPRIGIHWDASGVRLSYDADRDIVKALLHFPPKEITAAQERDGALPNRQVFITGALTRADLQRLIKHARRARDAAFGSDE